MHTRRKALATLKTIWHTKLLVTFVYMSCAVLCIYSTYLKNLRTWPIAGKCTVTRKFTITNLQSSITNFQYSPSYNTGKWMIKPHK